MRHVDSNGHSVASDVGHGRFSVDASSSTAAHTMSTRSLVTGTTTVVGAPSLSPLRRSSAFFASAPASTPTARRIFRVASYTPARSSADRSVLADDTGASTPNTASASSRIAAAALASRTLDTFAALSPATAALQSPWTGAVVHLSPRVPMRVAGRAAVTADTGSDIVGEK
jgi:hypothetical protein